MGEERSVPGGVMDHGTQEEDGPGTWDTLSFLVTSGVTENPVILLRRRVRRRTAHGAVKKSVRNEVGRLQGETGAPADEARESEGCKVAVTPGNGVAPGPGRAKAARVDVSFRRETCPTPRRWGSCHRNF